MLLWVPLAAAAILAVAALIAVILTRRQRRHQPVPYDRMSHSASISMQWSGHEYGSFAWEQQTVCSPSERETLAAVDV